MRTEIHVKFAKLNQDARLPTQGSTVPAGICMRLKKRPLSEAHR